MALTVIDRAIQSFGAEGVSQDQELAIRWAHLRTLRIADVGLCLSRKVHLIEHALLGTRRCPYSTSRSARTQARSPSCAEDKREGGKGTCINEEV